MNVASSVENSQGVNEGGTDGHDTAGAGVMGGAAGMQADDGYADEAMLADLLAVHDVDPSDAVIFQVTGLPQHGTLYLGEKPLGLGETFSQFDMDHGVLTYQSGAGELEPGTYSVGDTAGLPADHYDIAWSGLDVYGVDPTAIGGQLDLSMAVAGTVDVSAHGLSVAAADAGKALLLDFRAEVSGVRMNLHDGQDGLADGLGRWQTYDANGGLTGAGVIGTTPAEAPDGAVAIASESGAAFRYVLLHADDAAPLTTTAGAAFYVRTVEFDVAPAPLVDAFTFRAEDGLPVSDGDTAALGYTIVDGEAIFNIALVPDLG